jgi:DNA-binding XRE family transcriptional regulator
VKQLVSQLLWGHLVIRRSIDKDPELLAMLKDSSVNAQVSMIIYDVRKQAGLTQRQLADLVGTTRSPLAQAELSISPAMLSTILSMRIALPASGNAVASEISCSKVSIDSLCFKVLV